jgi:CxxC motif-containing protein (DUF1111 family)
MSRSVWVKRYRWYPYVPGRFWPSRAGTGVVLTTALAGLLACAGDDEPVPVYGEPGEPLSGLSAEERAAFDAGAEVFGRHFTPEDGLGPRFNENSCDACHTFPADGGTGETNVRRVSVTGEDGRCDALAGLSGPNLRIQVTPALAAAGGRPERDTGIGSHTAVFTIPLLYGAGLVEAIPLETLRALADPDDRDGDGISGRLGTDPSGRPARFGRKADVATLEDFVDSAFRLEMGITTPAVPDEDRAGNPPGVPDGMDPAGEPEVDPADFAAVTAFVRFLAPPVPTPVDEPLEIRGEELFSTLGCTGCHVPVLVTGPSESPALDRKAVALYSDLLLHDLGPGLESVCTEGASTSEHRTEPLMGLRHRDFFLHDGRVTGIMDAILAHGGEAEAARNRFAALDRLEQEAVLEFLRTR